MPSKTYTGYLEERRGHWTHVEIETDRIIVSPSRAKTHWVATLLTAMVLACLATGLLQSPAGTVTLLCIAFLAGWHYTSRTKRPAIIIDSRPKTESNATTYHVNQVRKFSIRENEDRNPNGDSHLLQIYMELRGQERLILLYQDYCSEKRNKLTRDLFMKMSGWLKNAK